MGKERIRIAGKEITLKPLPKEKRMKVVKRKVNNPALDRVEKTLCLLTSYK